MSASKLPDHAKGDSMTDHDHPDTDLTDHHGEAEALRRENARLRGDLRHVITERDNTFRLMQARAEAAEAAIAAEAEYRRKNHALNEQLAAMTPPPDAELDALAARLRSFDGVGHTRFAGKTMCESAAAAITALRAQPDWKAMAERLGKALQETLAFARALEKQSSRGTAGRRGGAIFARAEAALSDLAKMKGE